MFAISIVVFMILPSLGPLNSPNVLNDISFGGESQPSLTKKKKTRKNTGNKKERDLLFFFGERGGGGVMRRVQNGT